MNTENKIKKQEKLHYERRSLETAPNEAKFLYLIALFIFLGSCCSQRYNMLKMSEDIYTVQGQKFGSESMDVMTLHLYRERSDWLKKMNYSDKNDTIFILELPGIQGDIYFTFWNKKDTLSYTSAYPNSTGEYKIVKEVIFTKYMMKLVSEWNISEIRKEEEINSNLLPSEFVYATRIIVKNKKYKIECIRFDDFYNLERDSMDFIN